MLLDLLQARLSLWNGKPFNCFSLYCMPDYRSRTGSLLEHDHPKWCGEPLGMQGMPHSLVSTGELEPLGSSVVAELNVGSCSPYPSVYAGIPEISDTDQ